MEVGPLARYVMGYAKGMPEFKEPVDMVLKKLDVPITAPSSPRSAARRRAAWKRRGRRTR
jgi:hydrogenase large subunit